MDLLKRAADSAFEFGDMQSTAAEIGEIDQPGFVHEHIRGVDDQWPAGAMVDMFVRCLGDDGANFSGAVGIRDVVDPKPPFCHVEKIRVELTKLPGRFSWILCGPK